MTKSHEISNKKMVNSAQKTSKMITLTEAVSNYQNSMVETDSNKKR